MPFPTDKGWILNEGIRPQIEGQSLRFFVSDTTTAAFADRAYAFVDGAHYKPLPASRPGQETPTVLGSSSTGGAPIGGGVTNPASPIRFLPPGEPQKTAPAAWARNIIVRNKGGTQILVSFDGVNTHDIIAPNSQETYYERHEGGIAVREAGGGAIAFHIVAW